MALNCFECNSPIEVNDDEITETFISPEICSCNVCSEKGDNFFNENGENNRIKVTPKISYRELRQKEREEIEKHQWYQSEKAGYQIEKELSKSDWRSKFGAAFLEKWGYR